MKTLQHLHILVKASVSYPRAVSLDQLEQWVEKTVVDQGLEPVIGPHVVYVADKGNEGPTGSVNIKTSHMAFHIWENQHLIQADLYTCGDLDVDMFLKAFDVFSPTKIEYLVLDRAKGFKIINGGVI
jgi:S-adenosylmethionine/arginine decarboxylase-like enzyme